MTSYTRLNEYRFCTYIFSYHPEFFELSINDKTILGLVSLI